MAPQHTLRVFTVGTLIEIYKLINIIEYHMKSTSRAVPSKRCPQQFPAGLEMLRKTILALRFEPFKNTFFDNFFIFAISNENKYFDID